MRRLDDLLEDYTIDEKTDIQFAALSREEEEMILMRTLEKAGLPAVRRKRKFKLGICLMAAAFVILGVSANAAGLLRLDERMLQFFHADDPVQIESLGGNGAAIEKSVEQNSYTLTVEQVVGDKYSAYILMEMEGPDGAVLDKDTYGFESAYFSVHEDQPYGLGYSIDQVKDANPADNKASFILTVSGDASFAGKTVDLTLMNMRHYNVGEQDPNKQWTIDAEGSWSLSFPLEYTSASKLIKINKEIAFAEGKSTLKEITVSPLSVSAVIEGKSVEEYDKHMPDYFEKEDPMPDSQERLPFIITFSDGSRLAAANASSSIIQGQLLIKTVSYDKLMDIEQIDSITIGDITVSLKGQ